ncbi:MAG: hypothetical protein ACJ8F7_01050 [Gemmataceae bacterium]
MATATRTRYVAPKARNDAYTGLLFISFLALVVSSILLFLDYNQYGSATPPKVSIPGASAAPNIPPPDVAVPSGDQPGGAAGDANVPKDNNLPKDNNPPKDNPAGGGVNPMPINPGGGGGAGNPMPIK